jgi:dTDP-4-dehydrorhamnose reductase
MLRTARSVKLLVLGAGGQVGSETVRAGGLVGHVMVAATREMCDITDAGAVAATLDEHRPDAVINCAAWTAVDAAEDHEEAAAALNAEAPAMLASACTERHVRLCHISTDYVFDGSGTTPIPEDAPPNPLSAYGRTKLAGEQAVRERCPDHVIARSSWIFGGHGPNFVLTMLRLIENGGPLRVVADQRGAPTWAGHLGLALVRLVTVGPPGTYHLTGGGETTWHGLASAIVEDSGASVEVVPIPTGEFPTRAVRPRYSVLDNGAWRVLGEPPLPNWRDGLQAYLSLLGKVSPALLPSSADD